MDGRSRFGGRQAVRVDWSWHGGTQASRKQNHAGDFCSSQQRQRIRAQAKTQKYKKLSFQEKHEIPSLCSYRLGSNDLAPKWWRYQVHKAGG